MSSNQVVQVTIIIVNYNVQYFLEQALHSVATAAKGMNLEVFVVDNNSKDGSVDLVKEQFPEVKLIANTDNPGFSIANNQAIRKAKGKYILLLNPDTILQEDTLIKCWEFMESHPAAGALGVKMLDGSGQFLPESKRGFPTPFVAFCKTFGLSRLFPKSKIFNRYHLGFLDANENHEIEVLAGAFMWMRKSTLDEVGLLDEAFFMYGEDIDLSYRIMKSGAKNYYLANTKIIHYKGESTKKGSLNYVRVFYNAMIIFAKKHFQGERARLFVLGLRLAIYFRAFLTLAANLIKKAFLPLLDALIIFFGLYYLKDFWGVYHFNAPNYFGTDFLIYNAPLYTVIWLLSLYFNGAYDQGVNVRRVITGIFVGTFIIAAIYGFLDQEYRSSRMLILLGTFWASIGLIAFRACLGFLGIGQFSFSGERKKRILIIGDQRESQRVRTLIGKVLIQKNFIGTIHPQNENGGQFLGGMDELPSLVKVFKVNEIVFCLKNLLPSTVMDTMKSLGPRINYKTISGSSETIIGSSSKNKSGELYTLDIAYRLQDPFYLRSKRVLDIIFSLLLLITLPIHLILVPNVGSFLRNLFSVLTGTKTWIGYFPSQNPEQLPKIKPGVLPPGAPKEQHASLVEAQLNRLYASDYHWSNDLQFLFKAYRSLGSAP